MRLLNQRGVFLTFMVFMLVGTILALNIATSRSGVTQERNTVDESAFNELNNKFSNVNQQVIAREGYAGSVYGRVMPFSDFRSGSNWFEIRQAKPESDTYLKKSYDAYNLFAVFAEVKGSEGNVVDVTSVLGGITWEDAYTTLPKIEYMVLPQCLKFYVGDGVLGLVNVEKGSILSNGDMCDFQEGSVRDHLLEAQLDSAGIVNANCAGAFGQPVCENSGDPEVDDYVEFEISLKDCPCLTETDCTCKTTVSSLENLIRPGLNGNGVATISANLDQTPPADTVTIVYTDGKNFALEFDEGFTEVKSSGEHTYYFVTRVIFYEPFDEIVPTQNLFEFAVKNPAFGLCMATEGSVDSCGS